MNFKRKHHKNARAGCLLCKPWKMNKPRHKDAIKHSEKKRRLTIIAPHQQAKIDGPPRASHRLSEVV